MQTWDTRKLNLKWWIVTKLLLNSPFALHICRNASWFQKYTRNCSDSNSRGTCVSKMVNRHFVSQRGYSFLKWPPTFPADETVIETHEKIREGLYVKEMFLFSRQDWSPVSCNIPEKSKQELPSKATDTIEELLCSTYMSQMPFFRPLQRKPQIFTKYVLTVQPS